MCDNSRCSTYSWQLITTAGTWSDHFDRRRQMARGPFSLELTECWRSLLTLMTMEQVQKWYLCLTSHCCEPHLEQFFFLCTVESLHPLLKFQLYAYCTSTSVGKGEFINKVSYSMELTVDLQYLENSDNPYPHLGLPRLTPMTTDGLIIKAAWHKLMYEWRLVRRHTLSIIVSIIVCLACQGIPRYTQ